MASTKDSLYLRESCPEQRILDESFREETAVIQDVAKSGNLDLMLSVEYALERQDLTFYARTDLEKKLVEQGLRELDNGLVHYRAMKETPQIYRDLIAKGINKRDPRGLPKDGMRDMLSSQAARLSHRHAYTRSDPEKQWQNAREALIKAIQIGYIAVQKSVLETDSENEPTPQRQKRKGS